MTVIRQLDSRTIAKIAAGEVVERPLSAVKELIENAIDAGGTSISIDIEDGGMKKIAVSDNGAGMSPEDVELCAMSHTTSKLRDITDLSTITTLGFRGEALCSMAAVSRLTVISRPHASDIGHRVRFEGGTRKLSEPAPRAPGTTVEVENLFFNVPARLKFQKSIRSELQAITGLVSRFMINRPEVAFRLTSGGEEILNAPPAVSRMDRIRHILGKDLAAHLRQSGGTFRGMELTAFFSMPDLSFSNRKYQIYHVNGHLVKDKTISMAVDVAYKGLVGHGRFPLAILFIDLPPGDADFNVHPAKTEIRFARPHDAHSLIYRTLRTAFMEGEPRTEEYGPFTLVVSPDKKQPPAEEAKPAQFDPPRQQPSGGIKVEPPATLSTGKPDLAPWEEQSPSAPAPARDLKLEPVKVDRVTEELREQSQLVFAPEVDAVTPEPGIKPAAAHKRNIEILGQFFNTFILARIDGIPVFIDQHVASERVVYDRLKKAGHARAQQMQLLGEPVEVPHDAYRILSDNIETIRAAGLEVEPFGERAFVVRSVVHNAGRFDAASLLASLASEISSTPNAQREDLLDRLLIASSCELAVQGGAPLTIEQMKALVDDFVAEGYVRTCPHGRPIVREISHDEMKSWFKR